LKIVSLSEGWKKSAFNLTSSVKLKELELFGCFFIDVSLISRSFFLFCIYSSQVFTYRWVKYEGKISPVNFFAVVKIYSFHHCSVYTWHIPNRNISSRSLHTHLSSRQYLKRHILTRTNFFFQKKKLSMLTNIARLN